MTPIPAMTRTVVQAVQSLPWLGEIPYKVCNECRVLRSQMEQIKIPEGILMPNGRFFQTGTVLKTEKIFTIRRCGKEIKKSEEENEHIPHFKYVTWLKSYEGHDGRPIDVAMSMYSHADIWKGTINNKMAVDLDITSANIQPPPSRPGPTLVPAKRPDHLKTVKAHSFGFPPFELTLDGTLVWDSSKTVTDPRTNRPYSLRDPSMAGLQNVLWEEFSRTRAITEIYDDGRIVRIVQERVLTIYPGIEEIKVSQRIEELLKMDPSFLDGEHTVLYRLNPGFVVAFKNLESDKWFILAPQEIGPQAMIQVHASRTGDISILRTKKGVMFRLTIEDGQVTTMEGLTVQPFDTRPLRLMVKVQEIMNAIFDNQRDGEIRPLSKVIADYALA